MREFIEWLTEAAENLPEGLDSALDLTICDRRGKQFIDHVEVEPWRAYSIETGRENPDGPRGVYIIGHWHPDESPGKYLRAMTADVDDELRDLTGDQGG